MSGLRTFVDGTGRDWTVWEVVPRGLNADAPNRRSSVRRADIVEERPTERRHRRRRLGFAAGLDGGWLVFESRGERRRLAPVPPDWDHLDEASLERYCRSAVSVRRRV